MIVNFANTKYIDGTIYTSINSRKVGYGSGLIFFDKNKKFLVSIPKNASSFSHKWASLSGWSSATAYKSKEIDWDQLEEIIIIVRDPVERWISGVSQYIKAAILKSGTANDFIANYNGYTERLIFDNVSNLDDHVFPQIYFFKDLYPEIPRKYIYINKNFEFNLKQELSLCDCINNLDKNRSIDDSDKKELQDFFHTLLQKRKRLCKLVKNAYKKDYEFIENNHMIT